ncbi:MAG: hypothetical protein ACOYOK_02270 [Pseudobdellovibrionaceae bacterium]|jgi:hypothetical protein
MFIKSIVPVLLMSTSVSLACPDLAGTYQCAYQYSEGKNEQISIQQDGNKFIIKHGSSDSVLNIIADGKKNSVQFNDDEKLESIYQCEENSLKTTSYFSSVKNNRGSILGSEYKKISANSIEFSAIIAPTVNGVETFVNKSTYLNCNKIDSALADKP